MNRSDPQAARTPGRPRRHWPLYAAAGALAVVALPLWLWVTLLSPIGYTAPDGPAPMDASREHRVFVYGTLRWAPVRFVVMGRSGEPLEATLPGYRRERLDLVADPEAVTDGLLLRVKPDELARLDRYERLGVRYERVRRTLDDGARAWVYRRMDR